MSMSGSHKFLIFGGSKHVNQIGLESWAIMGIQTCQMSGLDRHPVIDFG